MFNRSLTATEHEKIFPKNILGIRILKSISWISILTVGAVQCQFFLLVMVVLHWADFQNLQSAYKKDGDRL